MAYRFVAWLAVLAAAAVMTGCGRAAEVRSCEDVVGRWSWFVGGDVDVTRDGQFTQQSGNAGTWECSDAARGEVVFRWRVGGFVNRMVMSADGASLTSVDPTQTFVTARRAAASGAPSTAPNIPPSGAPSQAPPGAAPLPPASERARLAALINDDYKGLTLTLVSSEFFGENSVIRTRELQVDQSFHLVKGLELCDVGWTDEFLNGKYKVTERTHLDCDAQAHGLKWDKRTETIDLTTIDPGSIEAQGTPVHRTRLRFGYRGNRSTTSYLECRNHAACVRMLGNFTALVQLAASGVQVVQRAPTPATAGSQVETLVARINAQYVGSQDSLGTRVFKSQSAVLEPGDVLVLRDLKCDGDGNPRFKDLEFEIAAAQRARLSTQLAADCDARRDGLAWQPTVSRLQFKKMRYPKFEVVQHTDGHLGTHSIRLTTLQTGVERFRPDDVVESIINIACKDQRGCDQMARDLDALVNAIGVPRGTYQRPAER